MCIRDSYKGIYVWYISLVQNMKVKIYFHVHTKCSKDAIISIKDIEEFLRKNKDAILVICDHNTSRCANYLKKRFPKRIIVGVEKETKVGEIVGIFVSNYENTKDPIEFILSIKKNQGLVCIPHPKFFNDKIEKYLEFVDFIETFNGRHGYFKFNAEANIIKSICGCDAHSLSELESCCITMSLNKLDEKLIKEKLISGEFKMKINYRVPGSRCIATFIKTFYRTMEFKRIISFFTKRIL